jgi:hypothetical protein
VNGKVTVDITEGAKTLFENAGESAIVLIGPNENEIDSPDTYWSEYTVESLTLEKA